ncbi:hypothetical protein OKW30_005787 [Paraburkholderia sp. Clong3]|nr:hypothetical protein [Paraburkholderia sp. CI2]
MDMGVSFVANLQASKRAKPRNRSFDWPMRFSETAAVWRTDFCERRRDAMFLQALSMILRTVAPVALNNFRSMQWTSPLATNARMGSIGTKKRVCTATV